MSPQLLDPFQKSQSATVDLLRESSLYHNHQHQQQQQQAIGNNSLGHPTAQPHSNKAASSLPHRATSPFASHQQNNALIGAGELCVVCGDKASG
jgi:hypothetical protein